VSDRSKYSSALPWFRIVLKQRDFASFGRMGIARKIERAGETAGLPFSVHVHRMAGRRADLQPLWARASIGQGWREGRAPDRLASAAFSAADRGVLGANFRLVALRAAPSPLRRISRLLDRIDDRGSAWLFRRQRFSSPRNLAFCCAALVLPDDTWAAVPPAIGPRPGQAAPCRTRLISDKLAGALADEGEIKPGG
jgi:hypothetical protein